jgi:hypothetical protein
MRRVISKIMNGRLAIITMVIFLTGSGISFARQNAPKKTGPDTTFKCETGVRLEGKLAERTFYGPPGFGATPLKDTHESVFLLDLTSSITVEPAEGATTKDSTCLKTFRRVHQVQLFVAPAKSSEAQKMVGKVVVAVGLLEGAHLPSQHTDVIMDVETLTVK